MSTTGLGPAVVATPMTALRRRRLGDVLVSAKVITRQQLADVLAAQARATGPRKRLGELLTELALADERTIATALADQLGLSVADLSRTRLDPAVVRLLPQPVAERSRVLIVDRTPAGLVVAVSDPTNVLALDDVKLHTGANELAVVVATESQIRDQLTRAWSLGTDDGAASAVADADGLLAELGRDADSLSSLGESASDDSAPVVRLVTRILSDAVRLGASDIHIETQRDQLRVRYRVDGVLRDVMSTSPRAAGTVISRVKIISGLDIAERRVPQDGRSRITVDGQEVDCRVSTLPSLHGEKVVIRLLTRGEAVPSLGSLGMAADQLATFRSALSAPQGLVLITGPTGSGKTNTLYSALSEILSPEKNIITLEDPVEVQLPGITQVQVNAKTGMTFQAGLRSVLRQDPDIVLVGEVRDAETAELALRASLTGHLVLTTLHTNSAVAALTRLLDMGAQPFLVASSLTASVAQRLVRRPCATCAEPYTPDAATLALLGVGAADLAAGSPRRGTGCAECGGTGYRGRTAVFEVLDVDAAMRQTLLSDPSEAAVGALAAERGMTTLRAAAVAKALAGATTFEEALRLTAGESAAAPSATCSGCGRGVEADMAVCPWCATSLHPDDCRSCGRTLQADWRVCPRCSTPVTRRH